MSSILYNSAALSALQALNMTQQSLNTVQNQVSTGLAVATAADNSSYWSVAAQLNQDNGVVTAANTALTEGQSMLSTANSAINSVITTLNSMATALTEATESQRQPHRHQHLSHLARLGAHRRRQQRVVQRPQHPERHRHDDRRSLRDDRRQLCLRLQRDVQWRHGQHHRHGDPDGVWRRSDRHDEHRGQRDNLARSGGDLDFWSSDPSHRRAQRVRDRRCDGVPVGPDPRDADSHKRCLLHRQRGLNQLRLHDPAVQQQRLGHANELHRARFEWAVGCGGATDITAFSAAGGVASFAVSTQTYTPVAASTGLLTQNGIDLTQLGSSGESVVSSGADTTTTVTSSNALTAVNAALTAVTKYASTIGATQDRMTAANTFNSALSTNLQSGVSGLVDANMNTASTQLQALQTQEQLGIQSLSIANQNAQLILKLFG